jgi:hypothetical protein
VEESEIGVRFELTGQLIDARMDPMAAIPKQDGVSVE